eukprot:GFUD01029621.1.p1 GENE.GFUD01029621.1~~GFUD01029621.1.p1  ORF type:complete len:187 (+),score=44.70 GFUD01029621.1:118-678(+)
MSVQQGETMVCTKCGENIVGKAMKAGDKYWHESHFLCSDCGVRLRDTKVFQKDGALFCDHDYKKRFVPRCASCSGFILSDCIRALDQTWHPEHFNCYSCQANFDQGAGIHTHLGRPYCKACYIDTVCDRCHGCSKPITDKAMKALEHSWHVDCFVCKECGFSFEGKKNFYSVDGDPVCGACLGTTE